MNKDLRKKLNNLKAETTPDKEWKTALRSEIAEKENTWILFQDLTPKFAFGALAMAGLLIALITVNLFEPFPEVEMVENRVDARVMKIVEHMQEENVDFATLQEESMTAMEDTQPGHMVAEIDIDLEELSEEEREEWRKNINELLVLTEEVEENLLKVMGSQR